jgi:SHS2 domain-containing protein
MKVTSFNISLLSISVRVYGKKAVPENIIKAVTFHGLRVETKGGNWEIEVLFDI